jgi:predicted CopG family antitoxin
MCGDPMPNMTLSLPEDVYKIVKSHKEVRWSEIARRAIEDYAKKVSLLNAMTAQSELTQDEIMVLDKKIKSGVHQHYKTKAAQRTVRKQDSS